MKLYRSLGHIWTGTQADAKAAQGGKDFETIEVPTDKPGLLTWLNENYRLPPPARANCIGDLTDSDLATLDALGLEPGELIDPEAIGARVPHGSGNPPTHSASSCPACYREARTAAMVADAEASICARADIQDIQDVASADDLIARLQERRAVIVDMERGPPPTDDPMAGVLG